MSHLKLKKPLIWLFPGAAQRQYEKTLVSVVAQWEKLAREQILPRIPHIVDTANALKNPIGTNVISDSVSTIEFVEEQFRKQFRSEFNQIMRNNLDQFEDETKETTDHYELLLLLLLIPFPRAMEIVSQDVSDFNNRQWKKILKHSLDLDFFQPEPWLSGHLNSFVLANVALMAKLLRDVVNDIIVTINTMVREGKKAVDIIRQIFVGTQGKKGIFPKAKNRARAISNNEVDKLNGELQKTRQTEFGVTQFVWQTQQDNRVRSMHRPLQGKTCSWKNSTIYFDSEGNRRERSSIGATLAQPGEDFNCRCYASPVFSSVKDIELIV